MSSITISPSRRIFLSLSIIFATGIFIFSTPLVFADNNEEEVSTPREEEVSTPREEEPKIPQDKIIETIFDTMSVPGTEPRLPPKGVKKPRSTTIGVPKVTVPIEDCCEFTSISIRNVWEQNLEVTVAANSGSQTKVIYPNSTHTFSGNLGQCIRISAKGKRADPKTKGKYEDLVAVDIPVCCKDLKKGVYPSTYGIKIVNFTFKRCEEKKGPVGSKVSVVKRDDIGIPPQKTLLRLGINITKCEFGWLPEEGNSTQFTANIYKWVGTGWEFPGVPRVITFKLSEVSKEKGVCLNKGEQTTPDLYFAPQPGFVLSGGTAPFFDTATTTGPVVSATVTVTSDDYGSYGKIKSSADNCEDIAPNGPVNIPFDENNNYIADRTRQDDYGAPANKDKDHLPKIDGHPGDGYTNYEEYRGFFIQERHQRTDIQYKDLMVNDQIGLGTGNYANSGVIVHLIQDTEIKDRIVNFNRGDPKTSTGPQHGVIVVADVAGELPVGVAGMAMRNPAAIAAHIMGPPKNVERVLIAHWSGFCVAHELGHATCAWHHGDADFETNKIMLYHTDPFYNSMDGLIRWIREGKPPTVKFCGIALPAYFYVHPKGGQQSGDVNCLMRYVNVFDAYREDGKLKCWPPDYEGTRFCTSPKGTGFNSGNLVGGDASPGRGNCLGKLRVNDK